MVRAEAREGRQGHQTMGESRTEPPRPENFLRKQTRDLKFRQRAKSARGHSELPALLNFTGSKACPASSQTHCSTTVPLTFACRNGLWVFFFSNSATLTQLLENKGDFIPLFI